jgi:predicted DNA-binding protein (MmcQ/YjbR family)
MNKKHWNTITAGGDVDDELFFELCEHSYDLIVSKLTKKQKEELNFF